ncbi:DUF6233 domain-containing protein [Streptomyces mirabilis]
MERTRPRGGRPGAVIVHIWDCENAPTGGDELDVHEALDVLRSTAGAVAAPASPSAQRRSTASRRLRPAPAAGGTWHATTPSWAWRSGSARWSWPSSTSCSESEPVSYARHVPRASYRHKFRKFGPGGHIRASHGPCGRRNPPLCLLAKGGQS